jgi:hypothetical protein
MSSKFFKKKKNILIYIFLKKMRMSMLSVTERVDSWGQAKGTSKLDLQKSIALIPRCPRSLVDLISLSS